MKKRIFSAFLALAVVLTLAPSYAIAATQTVSYNSYSKNNATIKVTDESGAVINDATVTVTRTRGSTTYVYEVYSTGSNGQYKFTRNTTSGQYYYAITVSADGYETQTLSMRANSSSTSVSLVSAEPVEQIETFRIYYIADGHVPDNGYAGANDAVDYGPSADNTPLVLININLTMLQEIAQQDNSPVVYKENSSTGNSYEFIPAGSHTDDDYLEKMEAFWTAVLSCAQSESIELFQETGLFNDYVGYCLKKQGDGSLHGDGILNVKPPVYVVELYQNETYFGGATTDQETPFPTAYDLLDQYEAHLEQNITWEENASGKPLRKEKADGTEYYTGTYIDTATSKIHVIEVYQFEDTNAVYVSNPLGDSEIPYVRQTDTYYLAKFNMSVDEGTTIRYTITYTDGISTENVFNDHEYAGTLYKQVPAFTGVTIRENYEFQGWVLEGDETGTVYSDQDIANMTVTGNMVFHAAWIPIPKYTATVVLVLNGTYDSTTGTLTSGTMVDLETLLNTDNVTLGLSEDGVSFTVLTKEKTGIYSSILENGNYHLYVSFDGGATWGQRSSQYLSIDNMDRTRYLFYNDVIYDLNGGTLNNSTENYTTYHLGGSSVSVYGTQPVREGYLFLGWKAADGTVYAAGDVLTPSIARSYTLTAQWAQAADIYVHIKIDHVDDDLGINDADEIHDVGFTVDRRLGSTGNYTEIYDTSILWDGTSQLKKEGYEAAFTSQGAQCYTTYTPTAPNISSADKRYSYTVTATKPGYEMQSVTSVEDENGDIHLYATLVWAPRDFDLTFEVELDQQARQLNNKNLWPAAVNVKVTTWEDGTWHTISRQQEIYERVAIDSTGCGTGTYPVGIGADDASSVYHYRIEVVSYELQDGTIVAAENIGGANTDYNAPNNLYKSQIIVTNGADPDATDSNTLTGVWYGNETQQGSIKALVSIPVFTVTFLPNGGTLNGSTGSTVLKEQIFSPDTSAYIPTREGGYVFEGWFVQKNGQMTDQTMNAGLYLTENLVLVARWRDPISVEGMVTVGATYEQENSDGTITYQTVYDMDRATYMPVLLQKKTPSGYYETVDYQFVTLDYTKSDFYYQGRAVGIGFFSFTQLPDDGSVYRINILSANYTATYQNEPESATQNTALQYNTYTTTDYDALTGDIAPDIATVHAHLHFTPPSFDLKYQIDATKIGKDFRPKSAQILVTCDADPAIVAPEDWQVISQMNFDGVNVGDTVALSAGFGEGSASVWQHAHDGATFYDYGICLQSTTTDGIKTAYAKDNPYFSVVYQAPAHYVDTSGDQSQMLIATLVPKTYHISYEPNGGTIYGLHTHTHTWSYETSLSDVVPVRSGYSFAGWYTDAALTQPLTGATIAADVAQDITFYAKWVQVNVHLQVFIDHTTDDQGLAGNYEKLLHAQLCASAIGESAFSPVSGEEKAYSKLYWHTRGDGIDVDIMEVPNIFTGLSYTQDYNVDVTLDGYYTTDSCTFSYVDLDENGNPVEKQDTVTSGVTKTVSNDGSTVDHYVVVCLKFDPDTMDLNFTVEMSETMDTQQYPASAQVKVVCWGVLPEDQTNTDWQIISQHEDTAVTVALDPLTGKGTGTCPVWRYLDSANKIPYYYRIEVVSITFEDGTVVALHEETDEVLYTGSGYCATVYAENGCEIPAGANELTQLTGAYGIADTNDQGATVYHQVGTLRAVINAGKVVFHANNEYADGDIFRTYYPAITPVTQGTGYNLTANGTVPVFYDIPEFDYNTNNRYVFKGWYTAPGESGTPITFSEAYNGTDTVHLYAHWIETGSVSQAQDDEKQLPAEWAGRYPGFELVGIQVRTAENETADHYGEAGSGLRFITVLAEDLYDQINALSGTTAEYGFVMAKAATVPEGTEQLLYKGANVNGTDTRSDYSYAINMKCSGVSDHYNGTDYRLYTCVVTYKSAAAQGEEVLAQAHSQNMVARSYIRYTDANGLLRTYHSNYTGASNVGGGCSASYNLALELLTNG